jgi:RNA polymerase sigma-70 factor (sigma-E family)
MKSMQRFGSSSGYKGRKVGAARMPEMGGNGFEEFLGSELPRLLRLARQLTGNDHDAWDLTQDALIRVGRRWRRVDRDGNPSAYARRCLVRQHWTRLRRHGREVPVAEVPSRQAPDQGMASVEVLGWLEGILAQLGPRQRTVVVLRYAHDLTVRQIADEIGCSEGTVKSQLSRALDRLRQISGPDPRGGSAQSGPAHGRDHG